MQQESASALPLGSLATVTSDSNQILLSTISVNLVVQLLERVYYALNWISLLHSQGVLLSLIHYFVYLSTYWNWELLKAHWSSSESNNACAINLPIQDNMIDSSYRHDVKKESYCSWVPLAFTLSLLHYRPLFTST